MSTPLLSLHNLRCERDDRVLFANLNYEIGKGDIVQVQGPNGSGKTTLLRILLGLNNDYSGELRFEGQPLNAKLLEFRQQLLYIGHLPAISRSLSPVENLRWFGHLHGADPSNSLEDALRAVGLRGFEDVPGHHLSAGQHRRVALARLYLSQTSLWVLDEPFTAIDTLGVDKLRAHMANHTANGGTIILTSHQALDLDQLRLLDLADFRPQPTREVA